MTGNPPNITVMINHQSGNIKFVTCHFSRHDVLFQITLLTCSGVFGVGFVCVCFVCQISEILTETLKKPECHK